MDRRPIHYRLIIALNRARQEGLSDSSSISWKVVSSPDVKDRLRAELTAMLGTEFYEDSPPYINVYQNYAGLAWEVRTDVPENTLRLVWTIDE